MVVTPAAPNYPALFREHIIRSLHHLLANIRPDDDLLSPEERNHALHVLSYALKLPPAWPAGRVLLLRLAPKMEQAGRHEEWLPYLEQGLAHSQTIGDDEAAAELHLHLGVLYELRGDYDAAQVQFAAGAKNWAGLGAASKQAQALNRLAYVARRQRRFAAAEQLVGQALALLDEQAGERAYSWLVLGSIALDRQAWAEAARFFQQALEWWTQENNRRMMAWSLTNLGAARRPMAKYEAAIHAYQQAIVLLGEIHDPINQAVAQMNLGNVYLDLHQPDQALALYEPAERVFRRAQEQLRLAKIYTNIGLAYRQQDQWLKATEAFQSSVDFAEKTGHAASLLNALDGLGLVYLEQAQFRQAETTFERALAYLAAIEEDPLYEAWLETFTNRLSQARKKDRR